MDGRIVRPGGRFVHGGSRTGVVFDRSQEDVAFQRWQREEFADLERLFAAAWRKSLQSVDLSEIAKAIREYGIDPKSCRTMSEAQQIATRLVDRCDKKSEQLFLAVHVLNIPQQYHHSIGTRWDEMGRPTLREFSPFTAHVLTVELFFQVALGAGLISPDRNSNRTDVSYLFYLPFCQVFISSDRLHKATAGLFLRSNQEFIWGQDIKADLGKINSHFLTLPEADREAGIMKIAPSPPLKDTVPLISGVWDRYYGGSDNHNENIADRMSPEQQEKLIAEFRAFSKGKVVPRETMEDDGNSMSVERRVRKKKGSWWQVPKDVKDDTW
jgi:hypothetical protein